MYSVENDHGSITAMIGIVAIVLVGAGFSLAANKRFSYSKDAIALGRQIEQNEKEILNIRLPDLVFELPGN